MEISLRIAKDSDPNLSTRSLNLKPLSQRFALGFLNSPSGTLCVTLLRLSPTRQGQQTVAQQGTRNRPHETAMEAVGKRPIKFITRLFV